MIETIVELRNELSNAEDDLERAHIILECRDLVAPWINDWAVSVIAAHDAAHS